MATINLVVTASADDAKEETDGDTDINNNANYMFANEWWGARWQNVTVPQGATIDTATLQINITSTSDDDIYLDLYGDDTDSASAFSAGSGNNDISGRTPTTAKVDWDDASAGAGWQSKEVKTIIQEIVNRGTWNSGNALAIIADCQANCQAGIYAWDYDAHQNAPKLDITYTAATTIVAVASHHYRMMRSNSMGTGG
jgi:MSHA biogenesis protein MshQ